MFVDCMLNCSSGSLKNIKDYDFICLSETKTDNICTLDCDGYTPFVLEKKCLSHKYGGMHGGLSTRKK